MDDSAPVHNGACLVLLEVPVNTEFGIDWKFWRTGLNFRGVKYIPSGPHFVYYSSTSDADVGPRAGFFIYTALRQLVVKKWVHQEETFMSVAEDSDDWRRVNENLDEVKAYLGPYPQENFSTWLSLTKHITPRVIAALSPSQEHGIIYSMAQYSSPATNSQQRAAAEKEKAASRQRHPSHGSESSESDTEQTTTSPQGRKRPHSPLNDAVSSSSRSCERRLREQLSHMKEIPGTRVQFTRIPSRARVPEHGPVSQHNLDRTFTLESIIQQRWGDPGVAENIMCAVAELQFAFVCFILGNVYHGFEQWKRLVRLLCSCEVAVRKYPALYSALLTSLYHQLAHVPEDFLTDIVTHNNVVATSLHSLFSNCGLVEDEGSTEGLDENVKQRALGLSQFCEKKFHWQLLLPDLDDEAPVVVELDDNVGSTA